MKRVITTFCAAAMAVTSIAAFAGASQAAPMTVPSVQQTDSNVVQVRDRDRFERRGNNYYYNGQRGDRNRRAGWRQHNGYWFPPAAFLGGVVVGGLIDNDRPVRYSTRHIRWCENNRPNYRSSDNTWKRPGAPRRACNSPFD